VRALVWIVLLVCVVACGKRGAPLRHPPQPRQAIGSAATTPPTVQEAAPAEPAAVVAEPDPDAPADTEVKP
jgi:predicted small lipoprotein YifL